MKKRKWSTWPSRFLKELNVVSGLAGLFGALISIAGIAVWSSTGSMVLGLVGVVLLILIVTFSLIKSFPPGLFGAVDKVGQVISVAELAQLEPRPVVTAILGVSNSGKTTLRQQIPHGRGEARRTQKLTAMIIAMQTVPPRQMAILDGGGEIYAHQFEMTEYCDHLCVILDHNESDTANDINENRLKDHSNFSRQIRDYMDNRGTVGIGSIRLVMNKHDLWKSAPQNDVDKLHNFLKVELDLWRQGSRSADIQFFEHSNRQQENMSNFYSYLNGCNLTGRGGHV